jgi:ABC-type methionine transport system ATPase subunit
MQAKIEVRDLHIARRGQPILHGVGFCVQPGEVMMLIGPSGSGKSTLLRAINRLLEPPSNNILLDGEDITTLPVTELRSRVGMVFQQASMFPGSVAENIAHAAALKKTILPPERIYELLEAVSLHTEFALTDAAQLSGGEAQRVALARTLATSPEVLLLDEPTSALDPHATRQVEKTLLHLNRERGLTLIWVSHTIEQTRRVGGNVVLLNQGQVQAMGRVAEVLDPNGPYQKVLDFAAGEDIRELSPQSH